MGKIKTVWVKRHLPKKLIQIKSIGYKYNHVFVGRVSLLERNPPIEATAY